MKRFSLRNPKLYNSGAEILSHLPDPTFWFIWPIWRGLTESLELKLAREDFNRAITVQVNIEEMILHLPENQGLKQRQTNWKELVHETYQNLMETASRYRSVKCW